MHRFVACLGCICLAALFITGFAKPKEDKWITLFNGKDMDGWSPKVKGYAFGDNFGDTFRVADGVIKVSYDRYGDDFGGRFGHLFYKTKFSSYRLRLDYRFTGEQMKGGPGWAYRNSGIMIFCQDPASMGKDQDFPVSIEVQLLGGDGTHERHTANVCTPGTNIVMGGKLITQHCNDSNSKTYHGDQWVNVEVEVHGNKLTRHLVNGEEVIHYEQPQLDPQDAEGKKLIKDGNLMLSNGYISLQSESHPVEFRNIEIQPLDE